MLTKIVTFLVAVSSLAANDKRSLDRLAEYDRETCSEVLQSSALPELWSSFLKGQAVLFFDQEAQQLSNKQSWLEARDILELGSGNGAYLYHLSETFKDKTYLGIERQAQFVEQARALANKPELTFAEGDAEIESVDLKNRFDVVLYRLTLQHLKDPRLSLQLAHKYLRPDGHVIIIDSYDPAKASSHSIQTVEEASRLHNEHNRVNQKGNRKITIELLEKLQNNTDPLADLYEVIYTSLDAQGNRLDKGIRFESENDRKRYFNHILLFLAILNKGYEVPVDFQKAHDELQVYLEDETSWISPGMHFLILKKKSPLPL